MDGKDRDEHGDTGTAQGFKQLPRSFHLQTDGTIAAMTVVLQVVYDKGLRKKCGNTHADRRDRNEPPGR